MYLLQRPPKTQFVGTKKIFLCSAPILYSPTLTAGLRPCVYCRYECL